jgi:hypothetical protein
VAADVTLTGRLLEVTGAAVAGKTDLATAEAEIARVVELADKLEARLHLAPVRRDVQALVRGRLAALLAGNAPSARAAELVGILELSQQLGLVVDLWEAQNRLWEWAGSTLVTLDRETASRLARTLWFDEERLLARAGYAPREG